MKNLFVLLALVAVTATPFDAQAALNPQVDRFSQRTNVFWNQLVVCADSPAVYYIGPDAKRYAFPNDKAYFSYYPDFADVRSINCSDLAKFSLGGLVTYNPGTRFVKFESMNTVYAVEPGGHLRAIPNEEWMEIFVGSDWNKHIDDISDAFFTSYDIGQPLAIREIPDGMTARDPDSGIWYYFVDGQPKSLEGISFAFKGNGHFRNFTRLKSHAPYFYERVGPALKLGTRIGSEEEIKLGTPWFWSDTSTWVQEDQFPVVRLGGGNGSDHEPTIVYNNFSAWLPLDWESRSVGTGRWEVANDQKKDVASISCPSPETGYEAWDFTKSTREYTRDAKELYAGKWIGKPMIGSEDLGWLAMVWGGSSDQFVWGGTGCQIIIEVSSPPTADELDRIETIYQMIR